MQSWLPSLMFLTLITSPWLLSAIAFHGSSLFHSFYVSDCFLVVHLVLRLGSFLHFALPILPLYSLLISGPKSNLSLYPGFKSTSPLLIFLLVLSPTSHYFAIYSVNTKLIPNYSVLLLETSYCVRVGSVIIFILVRIICYSSSGFSLVWALNMQDVFKNKQMQCRCGLMVQSSNCEVPGIQILMSSKAFFPDEYHWEIWVQSVYIRQEWQKGVSCHFQLTDTISFCQSVTRNLCCYLKEEDSRS